MNTSNFVNLIGRVGRAPARKTLENGSSLLEISLATNDSYKDRSGNRIERTQWHRVKAFGPVVDILERYVNTGDQLSVVGTLRYNLWTDDAGKSRKSAEVVLDSFSFIGGRRREQNHAVQPTSALGQPQKVAAANGDDLPWD